jgi:hypothetical protein
MHANTLRYIGKLQLVLLPGFIGTPFEKSAYSIHIPLKFVCKRKSWTICQNVGILWTVFVKEILHIKVLVFLLITTDVERHNKEQKTKTKQNKRK